MHQCMINRISVLKKIAEELSQQEINRIADLLESKVAKVEALGTYFEGQKPGQRVPVFIVDRGTELGAFLTEPAVGVRFGYFNENPYKTEQQKLDYVNKLLGSLSKEYKVFVPSWADTVRNSVKNGSYRDYVLIQLPKSK